MNDHKTNQGQSGGVNIGGGNVTVGGDIIGRDKLVYNEIPRAQVDQLFQPLPQAVCEHQQESHKLGHLKPETAKAKEADDGTMAKLIDALLVLVPGLLSTVVSAFASARAL